MKNSNVRPTTVAEELAIQLAITRQCKADLDAANKVIENVRTECRDNINPDLRWLDIAEENHKLGAEFLADDILNLLPDDDQLITDLAKGLK